MEKKSYLNLSQAYIWTTTSSTIPGRPPWPFRDGAIWWPWSLLPLKLENLNSHKIHVRYKVNIPVPWILWEFDAAIFVQKCQSGTNQSLLRLKFLGTSRTSSWLKASKNSIAFFWSLGTQIIILKKKKHEKRSLTLNDNMSTSGYPGTGFATTEASCFWKEPRPGEGTKVICQNPGKFWIHIPKGTWTASVCCLQPMATTTVNNGQQPTPPRKNKTLHRCTEQRASCKNWGSSRPGTKKSFASAHAILSEEICCCWPAGRLEEDQKPSS